MRIALKNVPSNMTASQKAELSGAIVGRIWPFVLRKLPLFKYVAPVSSYVAAAEHLVGQYLDAAVHIMDISSNLYRQQVDLESRKSQMSRGNKHHPSVEAADDRLEQARDEATDAIKSVADLESFADNEKRSDLLASKRGEKKDEDGAKGDTRAELEKLAKERRGLLTQVAAKCNKSVDAIKKKVAEQTGTGGSGNPENDRRKMEPQIEKLQEWASGPCPNGKATEKKEEPEGEKVDVRLPISGVPFTGLRPVEKVSGARIPLTRLGMLRKIYG